MGHYQSELSVVNDNAKAWVEALRSGDYLQVRGKLVKPGEDGEPDRFCCLGVACELAVKAEVTERQDFYYGDSHSGTLPFEVMNWLGLRSDVGTFNQDVEFSPGWRIRRLSDLNDTAEWNFQQIADFIETEPEGLFQ